MTWSPITLPSICIQSYANTSDTLHNHDGTTYYVLLPPEKKKSFIYYHISQKLNSRSSFERFISGVPPGTIYVIY